MFCCLALSLLLAATPPADGLLCHLPLDAAQGDHLAAGHGLIGRAQNGAEWVPSPWGTGLRLSGSAQGVVPGGTLSPSNVTIAAMVRWEADPETHNERVDQFGAVVGKRHGANGFLLGIQPSGSGRHAVVVINGLRDPDRRMLTAKTPVPEGEWTFLAASYDGTQLRLWVNDQMAEATVKPAPIQPCPDDLTLGAEYPGSSYYRFRGALDEVAIWDRALTAEAVNSWRQALWQSATEPADTPPVKAEPVPLHVTVAQTGDADFVGSDDVALRAAIQAAMPNGTVTIRAGTYTIRRTLHLDGVAGLTIEGEGNPVLQLAALPHTTVATPAEKGARTLVVTDASSFLPGNQLRLEAPGKANEHDGKVVVSPTFDVRPSGIEGNTLQLADPLPYPAPAAAAIAGTENLLELRRGNGLTLRGLTLDGHKQPDDPTFVGHTALCTLLAHGPYGYEAGLTGEPIRDLRIESCTIRRAHGRLIAWYAVTNSTVRNCVLEETADAALDIDHFCYDLELTGNTIRRCGLGVEINDGSRCQVTANTIDDCRQPIVVWRWCHQDDLDVDNLFEGNTIRRAVGPAIQLRGRTFRTTVRSNTIADGQAQGIVVEGSDSVVEGNTITGCAKEAVLLIGQRNVARGNRVSECGSGVVDRGEANRAE